MHSTITNTNMLLGIDLGTTNSLVAVWQNGQAILIPNVLGDYLTPSCVGMDEDGTILVGKAARDRLQTHPEKTTSLFKRHMGTARTHRIGTVNYRPEELSSFVLRSLKEDAEAFLGCTIDAAVITVPAYFSDSQRKATRAAGQLAGLKVDRLLSEPTAAALAYGLNEAKDESKFLVFDLGGGTFDVSVIEKFEGVMEVRATAGDNFLGGEDFTQAIALHYLEKSGVPSEAGLDPAFQQQLVARAESLKLDLPSRKSDSLTAQWQGVSYSVEIDEDLFSKLTEDLLARLRMPVERALRDARIRATEIDNVILAGGATRMPLVRQLVTRMFGRFPNSGVNPDEVVAAGAAVMAGLKMKDAALNEIVMTDVCPYTLSTDIAIRLADGTEVEGVSSPIIERNTVVPVSRVKTYWPGKDNQPYIGVGVYQGEARYVQDNIKLGELRVNLPPAPRADGACDVRFTYDVNGLLEVETRIQKTGETQRLVIQSSIEGLSEAEIEERLRDLAQLKIHPRDKLENRTLLAQAERRFQQLLGGMRDRLGAEMMRFEAALEAQNERACQAARTRLRQVLEALDRDNYFVPEFDN